MSQIPGINPWLAMWNRPRNTVRAIIQHNPSYGVFCLAALFVLQSFFFYANWWSLGLKSHYVALSFIAFLFALPVGILWIHLVSYLFYWTGRLFKGQASPSQLRVAIAWSKIPVLIALAMWMLLLFTDPQYIFIQDGGGPSSLLINFVTLTFVIWSFCLTLQSFREVQKFSFIRSLLNVILGLLLTSVFFLLLFMLIRYLIIV